MPHYTEMCHSSPPSFSWMWCASWRRREIDSIGSIVFLLPLCFFIAWISWSYVVNSWEVWESSPDPGGLPGVFLWKSLIPAMAALLILQGCAEILRNLLVLVQVSDDDPDALEP